MKKVKIVNNLHILPGVLGHLVTSFFQRPHLFRYHLIRGFWQLIKETVAPAVESVALDRLEGLENLPVELDATSADRLVLTALSKRLQPATFFEIGTFMGVTTLAVARNNPRAQIYTLDLPDPESRHHTELEFTDEYLFKTWERGSAFRNTPEATRIQRLEGDSATFDFSPYLGRIDMVFIDASHSYSYVKADTEAALRMLSPTGSILWHDYPTYPGIYAYLNELAQEQRLHIFHPLHTGLAIYSRRTDILRPPSS